jgi:hypothetical protein
MDDQRSYESSKKISESIENINKWLKRVETEYNIIDDQQLYKSYEEIPNLIKGIDRWLETNKSLEDHVKELGSLLETFAENVKEKGPKIFDIGKYSLVTYLDCNRSDDGSIQCKHGIITYFYDFNNKDILIRCYSKTPSYEIGCIHYTTAVYDENHKPLVYRSFVLPDSPQNRSFIESIKKKFLNIFDTSFPKVLKNLDNQYICINPEFSIDLDKPIEKNPEIIKEDFYNYLIYNGGRYYMKIHGYTYTPPRNNCFYIYLL